MSIALCMIVKNEEDILPKTLPQFKKIFDEIIIVDTGSEDKTIEIIKSYGIEPILYKWDDDFAKARNESIKNAKSDWIVWLDADEYIRDEEFVDLKECLKKEDAECYFIKVLECKEGEFQYFGYLWRDKVFKNHCGLHFERKINEGIFRKNGGNVCCKKINVSIFHWGGAMALSSNGKRKLKKEERNIRIFSNLLSKNPTDFRANMLLGKNFLAAQKLDLAKELFKKAADYAPDIEGREANLVDASFCAVHLDNIEEAVELAKRALDINSKNVGANCNLALAYIKKQNIDEAEKLLVFIMDEKYPENSNYPVNITYYSYQRYIYLAQIYIIKKEDDKAIQILENGLKEYNDENLKSLIEAYKKDIGVKQ